MALMPLVEIMAAADCGLLDRNVASFFRVSNQTIIYKLLMPQYITIVLSKYEFLALKTIQL
jgi:hypothetical protein